MIYASRVPLSPLANSSQSNSQQGLRAVPSSSGVVASSLARASEALPTLPVCSTSFSEVATHSLLTLQYYYLGAGHYRHHRQSGRTSTQSGHHRRPMTGSTEEDGREERGPARGDDDDPWEGKGRDGRPQEGGRRVSASTRRGAQKSLEETSCQLPVDDEEREAPQAEREEPRGGGSNLWDHRLNQNREQQRTARWEEGSLSLPLLMLRLRLPTSLRVGLLSWVRPARWCLQLCKCSERPVAYLYSALSSRVSCCGL